jgi:Kazal-type serine protease inhibitor domain
MKKLPFAILFFAAISTTAFQCDTDCVSEAQADCICTEQYDPVCGCNQQTYGNSCMAECDGITDYTPGKCPR